MAIAAVARDIAILAVTAAQDKLGQDIRALDVSQRLGIVDVFVLVSAANERQVGAIVDAIEETLGRAGHKSGVREGGRDDPWVLLDFADVVIHVQHRDARALYALDRLWKDCPELDLAVAP